MPALRAFFIKMENQNIQLHEGETLEDLQFAGLRFIQSKEVFKFGTDAVLLSYFIQLKKGEHLVEFGTGSGIIPVLLSGRVQTKITGLEIQPEAAALAKRNMALNKLAQVRILQGDLKEATKLIQEHVDVVAVNPPYEIKNSGEKNKSTAHKIARHEVLCTLQDVILQAGKLLKQGGRFYMIHKAQRLVEVLSIMHQHKLEPKVLRFIANRQEEKPELVLVKGICGGRPGLEVLPTLNIYESPGQYAPEMRKIYHQEV